MPIKTAERPRLKVAEPLRKELLQQKPQASPAQGKPMSSKSPQEAPLPDRNPVHTGTSQGAGVLASSPLPTGCLKEAAVPTRTMKAGKRRLAEHLSMPVSSTQRLPRPSRTSKVVPVYSGTLEGALVTRSFQRQGANPIITEQQKQKQREQWRQGRTSPLGKDRRLPWAPKRQGPPKMRTVAVYCVYYHDSHLRVRVERASCVSCL